MISVMSTFIQSISCMNTFWYGPMSSKLRLSSSTSKPLSASFSMTSFRCASAMACGELPVSSSWSAPPPPPLPICSSESEWNMTSQAVVRKSISAFGCRPNAMGESWVMPFSMWSRYFSYESGPGLWKL